MCSHLSRLRCRTSANQETDLTSPRGFGVMDNRQEGSADQLHPIQDQSVEESHYIVMDYN